MHMVHQRMYHLQNPLGTSHLKEANKTHLFGHSHAIVYDFWGAIFALKNNIPALGTKSHSNKICKLVDTSLKYQKTRRLR